MWKMYEDEAMARGYARHRPALHRLIMAQVRRKLGLYRRVARALDVGCGSGLSTSPLIELADCCFGLELSAPMLRWARSIVPEGIFLCGSAEHLPFPERFFDLITAAGSLNYVDLSRALPELARVMKTGGCLVIYDFSQGRSFLDSEALDAWFEQFVARYPQASDGWRPITEETLKKDERSLRLASFDPFEMTLEYDAASYASYVMTETNVQQAIRNGGSAAEIHLWCEQSLSQVFAGETKAVVFRGYTACCGLCRFGFPPKQNNDHADRGHQ